MELRDLKTFAVIARNLSFNRTALVLNTAQSTVSARVAALEEELGVRLFDRIGRKVALTDAGMRLSGFAQRMLDLEDEAKAWTSGSSEIGGSLTVRIPESLCVHRMDHVITRFREQFPLVRMAFITCTLDGLETDLRQGVTDLALVYFDAIVAPDLRAELLGTESLVLAAAPSSPLVQKLSVGPADFQGVPLLLSKGDCSYRRMFEALLAERNVEPGTGLEFSSLTALKRCLALGLGVGLLPGIAVADEVSRGVLATLPWSEDPLESGILLVWHRKKWISPVLERFMALLREEIGAGIKPGASGGPGPGRQGSPASSDAPPLAPRPH